MLLLKSDLIRVIKLFGGGVLVSFMPNVDQ